MSSVVGAEFDLREGESELQRKQRIARHLRARAKERQERKRREGKSGRKKGEAATSGGSKDGLRVKPISGKKKA